MLPPIGEALGFHGALTFDVIVDERSGAPVLIEVNARPAGIMSRGRRAGVDFASAVRQMLSGVPNGAHTRAPGDSHRRDCIRRTWCAALSRGNSPPLRDWLAVATLADVPWTDPGVFLSNTRFLLSAPGAAELALRRPAVRVPPFHFRHHPFEGGLQVDALAVGHADQQRT
jgi:hypothetical protein